MGLIQWLFGKNKYQKDQEEQEKAAKIVGTVSDIVSNSLDKVTEALTALGEIMKIDQESDKKPEAVKSAILTNTTLSVALCNGPILVSYAGSKEMLDAVLECTTRKEIENIMFPEVTEEIAKRKAEKEEVKEAEELLSSSQKQDVDENLHYLLDSEEFISNCGNIYMKGINVPMPTLMVYKFAELVKKVLTITNINYHEDSEEIIEELDAEYQSLRNFWMWCVLCPNPQSRRDLFKFLKNHDMKINKNGHFFAYRRVESVAGNGERVKYAGAISSEYLRIKKAKKGPGNYEVIDSGVDIKAFKIGQVIPDGQKSIGNLKDLYENLGKVDEKLFTDHYSRKFDIKIGKEVKMDRSKCDSDNGVECSIGLHIGNKYFGFSGGFGDTHILVLVNPMNAVSVPEHDGNKMRVCAYYPVAVITNKDEQTTFLESADVTDLGNEYFQEGMKDLEQNAAEIKEEANLDKSGFDSAIEVLKQEKPDISAILSKRKVKV